MAFFAVSRRGVENYLALGELGGSLWLPAHVLSPDEIKILRSRGLNVSDFNYVVIASEDISRAVDTIEQHHPNEPIWVERCEKQESSRNADIRDAFLCREPIVGARLKHGDYVQIIDGVCAGQRGSLIAILSLLPEPTYLLELEAGNDIQVRQSALVPVSA